MITFQLQFSGKYQQKFPKTKSYFNRRLLFGSLKTLTFLTLSEISRFYIGFTDTDDVTSGVSDTSLHYFLVFSNI